MDQRDKREASSECVHIRTPRYKQTSALPQTNTNNQSLHLWRSSSSWLVRQLRCSTISRISLRILPSSSTSWLLFCSTAPTHDNTKISYRVNDGGQS